MLPGMSGIGGFAGSEETFLQSYITGTANFSASLIINKPVGTVSGDFLIGTMASQSGGTWTGASGWTERIDQGVAPTGRAATLMAGGSEPSSYTFTDSSLSVSVGMIMCFRGLQYDTIGGAADTLTGDGTLNITGITSAGGIIVALVWSNQASGSIAHSTPAGFAKVATAISSPNTYVGVSAFYKRVNAGATGGISINITGTTGENAGILLGLKP